MKQSAGLAGGVRGGGTYAIADGGKQLVRVVKQLLKMQQQLMKVGLHNQNKLTNVTRL